MTNTTTPSLIVMVPSFDAAWQDVDRCMAALHREKIEADRTGWRAGANPCPWDLPFNALDVEAF